MKRLTMLCWPALAALAMTTAAVGCNTDTGNGDDDGTTVVTSPIDIMADTNRDGFVDATDNEGEDIWTVQHGAAFLPNIDDDNWDGQPDANDGIVNVTPETDADFFDLSQVLVKAWPDAPDGTTATVTLDDLSIKHMRIFKVLPGGAGYELVAGSDGPCGAGGDGNCPYWNGVIQLGTDEIRAGVELRVEGRRLVGLKDSVSVDPNTQTEVPWSGVATLSYSIFENGALKTDDDNPTGVDVLQMRVAPWIMFGNLSSQIDTIFSEDSNANGSAVFTSGIKVATEAQGMESLKNTFCFNCFWGIGNWPDQWVEDWMQTGFVSIPWANDAVHGMRLTMPRPWGRTNLDSDLPVNWLNQNHVHPDRGNFVVYNTPHTGDSYDSHGNHDLIPAYGTDYPYGRIIYGSGVLPETKAFYEAQLVQAPAITADTSWLIVGHIDEVFSYVPANTERGWKLLVGSATLARTMLEQWQADGHGSEIMFQGKSWSNGQPAQVTIDETLADTDIMAWSQQAQAEIDGMLAVLQTELGLADDEIVEMPFLFERDFGLMVAYNPGTVNSLVFNGSIVIPDPFGPNINGVDGFKQDLIDRLGSGVEGLGEDGQGLDVYFTDNWDLYHRLLGEVHCGTNQEGPPQADIKWWEAMQ